VRPTAEAVRAELLEALAGDIDGARVLDLFAGAGAMGPDSYDVAFADPPYGSNILDQVIAAWRQRRLAVAPAAPYPRPTPTPGPSP